jgi:hypothetical protein
MQDAIGTTGHAFHPNLPISRVEQGQQFGGAITNILVGLPLGLTDRLPTLTRIRLGLKGTRLIGCPDV